MPNIAAWTILLLTGPPSITDSLPHDSAVVVLGRELAVPAGPTLFRGHGWRALWGDTVRLPRVTLGDIGGGVVWAEPEGPGSGAVDVAGADGRRYRLFAVNRDPLDVELPPHLRGTTVSRVLHDLLATTHPTAPLVASALYQGAGQEVVAPRLVLLDGDDLPEALAPWRGKALWLELDPRSGMPGAPAIGDVLTSDSLMQARLGGGAAPMALERFLAARLLDLVLGDRDRGPTHWLWRLDSTAAGPRWVPIATRQEQAFLNADGWSRWLLGRHAPGYGQFDATPEVAGLSATGYDFDRPLLALLEARVWDSVAAALCRRLSDAVIDAAVQRLPPAHQARSGRQLVRMLRARRDALPAIARQFYRLSVTYAEVELSATADLVWLRRFRNGDLELEVVTAGDTLHRRFLARETEELRLHLGEGADRVRLSGVAHSGVGVRLTGGAGEVSVIRDGSATRRVVLYGRLRGFQVTPPGSVRIVPRRIGRWRRWQVQGHPPAPPDWGVRRTPVISVAINQDVGFSSTLGTQWMRYGFGEPHYRQLIRLTFSYATRPQDVAAAASFERRNLLHNLHLNAAARATAIDVVHYYGLGNDAPRPKNEDRTRADVRELTLELQAGLSRRPELELRFGPRLTIGSTDTTRPAQLLSADRPYGAGRFDAIGLAARFRYAPAAVPYQRGLGLSVLAEGSVTPDWLDVTRGAFARLAGELQVSATPATAGRIVFRSRAGGAVLQGTIPFRSAARVGGPATLRGYQLDRFAGDRGAAYGAIEVQARVARLRVGFFSVDVGTMGFGDAGRVWNRGESSGTIHTSFGTGLWVTPAMGWLPDIDHLMLRLQVARGSEGTLIWLATGSRF